MNQNYIVEFKSFPPFQNYKEKFVFYRIVPKQLNLFQRLFKNNWKPAFLFSPSLNNIRYLFSVSDYEKYLKPLSTLYDVEHFLTTQQQQVKIDNVKWPI